MKPAAILHVLPRAVMVLAEHATMPACFRLSASQVASMRVVFTCGLGCESQAASAACGRDSTYICPHRLFHPGSFDPPQASCSEPATTLSTRAACQCEIISKKRKRRLGHAAPGLLGRCHYAAERDPATARPRWPHQNHHGNLLPKLMNTGLLLAHIRIHLTVR